MSRVLIVEDDDVIAEAMAGHLAHAGFDPLRVTKGDNGLARLRYEHPDVCILDLMLPGLDGWRLIETARGEGIGTPIIVISARGTEEDRIRALDAGRARKESRAATGSSWKSSCSTRATSRPTWTAPAPS